MSTPAIDRLELRRHLSSSKSPPFGVGGLPREITPLGDYIYFAKDAKADYHSDFADLIRFDPTTGKQTAVLRGDGKHFGSLPFTLQAAGDRLIVIETEGASQSISPSSSKSYVWSLRAGETRAESLLDGALADAPTDFVTAGESTYFLATKSGQDLDSRDAHPTVYRIDDDDTRANARLGEYDLRGGASIGAFTPFAGGLAIAVNYANYPNSTLGSYYPPYRTDIEFTPDGSVKHLRTLRHGDVRQSDDRFAVVGGQLMAEMTDKVILVKSPTATPLEYAPPTLKDADKTKVINVIDDHAIVSASRNSDGKSVTVCTDFTSRGTLSLVPNDGSFFGDGYRLKDALFIATGPGAPTPYDPEAHGKALASKPSSSATDDGTSLATTLVKVDLKTGAVTPVLRDVDSGEYQMVGQLTSVGDLVYFQRVIGITASGRSDLWRTDGTTAGTVRIGSTFSGPVNVQGHLFYTSDAASTTFLAPPAPTVGAVSGAVVRDDDHAKQLTDAMTGVGHVLVYLDKDGNGRRGKSEPSQRTADDGGYAFKNLKPGHYSVRLDQVDTWATTRGTGKSVAVVAGRGTSTIFGLADPKTARLRGSVKDRNTLGLPNHIAWIDLDSDHVRDANESSVTTTDRGGFEFDGLAAGTYLLCVERSDADRGNRKIPFYSESFTIGRGKSIDIELPTEYLTPGD